MRRLLIALALSAALFVVPSSASAQLDLVEVQSAVEAMHAVDPTLKPPPNDGKHDFAVGGFKQVSGLAWGVSAHSGPSGENAWGHVSTTIPTSSSSNKQFRWRVVCLGVVGTALGGGFAVLGLEPTDRSSNDVRTSLHLRDSGSAGVMDGALAIPPFGGGSSACIPPVLVGAIASGNIVIRDAQP